MARSVNKVILLGNLGKDPELKSTPSGQTVTRFSVATSDRWRDKSSGEWQERTEWHNVVCWSKLAETANQYLTKGSSVYIEGRLQSRSWDDKEGKRHYTTEIIAQEMVMTGSRGGGARSASKPGAHGDAGRPHDDEEPHEPRFAPAPAGTEISDDDIPF